MKYCKGDLAHKKLCPQRNHCLLYDNWLMKKIHKKEEGKELRFEQGLKKECKNYEVF